MATTYPNCVCCGGTTPCTPCCDNCTTCACSSGFDVDITISKSELSCHPCCTGNTSVSGSRLVKACIGTTGTPCPDTTSSGTPVHFQVTNSTDHCIWVQFLFTISGLTDSDCLVATNVCGSPLTTAQGRGNGVDLPWCFFCLGPGTVTLCMAARIVGPCKCCPQEATIGDWKYFVCCQDNTDFDCPVETFCAPFLTSCPQCCDCCCITDDSGSRCCNGADISTPSSGYSCTFGGGPCPTFPCVIFSTPPSTITRSCTNTYPNCISESVCTLTRSDAHLTCVCSGGGTICLASGHGDYIGSGDSCPNNISCPG